MQKILFVEHCKDLKAGGAQRVFLNIVKNISASKYEIAVAYKTPGQGDMANEISSNIRQYKYDSRDPEGEGSKLIKYTLFIMGIFVNFSIWLYRLISWRPDIVYTHSLISALHFGLLKPIFRFKLIYHEHNMADQRPDNLIWNLLFGLMKTKADLIIAIGEAVKKSLVSRGLNQNKITVVHNGIEALKFSTSYLRERGEKRLSDYIKDNKVIGMIGHFRRWKGQKIFVKMASELCKRNANLSFLIVGGFHDVEYKKEVEAFIKECGIEKNIKILGHQDNVHELLARFDIVVVPSVPEPFGLVVLEAMAMKKAVVSFDLGGPAEILIHRKTGILCNYTENENLSNAVEELLTNQVFCKEIEEEAYLSFTKNYLIEKQIRNIENVFEKLIN